MLLELLHTLSGYSAATWLRTIGKRSDLDPANLTRHELCCIRVLDEPSKKVGAWHRPAAWRQSLPPMSPAIRGSWGRTKRVHTTGSGASPPIGQSEDQGVPRSHRKEHWGWNAGGVLQRGQRGAMRCGGSARNGQPQCSDDRGPAYRISG